MKLFYYTYSYPFGLGERWKYHEILVFKKFFDEVIVVPFTFDGNYQAIEHIVGVKYLEPLYDKFAYPNKYKMTIAIFSSKFILKFIKEFFLRKVYLNKQWLISFLITAYRIIRIKEHPTIINIFHNTNRNDIHYFFWGRGTSEIIPFLRKNKYKIACRFHGYDLYKERNNGYIPFQLDQIKSIDLVLPCSEHGYNYIKDMKLNSKIFIARLGTISEGLAKPSSDGVLRIVSTSMVEPVKRVMLIAKSLLYVKSKIIWYHLGDGSGLEEIKAFVNKNNLASKAILLGKIPSKEVLPFYLNNPIDLFLIVSSSEGVPVSIMEAFSAGIPVYATDVGGTGEIVDSSVGQLLESDIRPEKLASYIDNFAIKTQDDKMKLRINAYNRYEKLCDAKRNASLLANKLLQI